LKPMRIITFLISFVLSLSAIFSQSFSEKPVLIDDHWCFHPGGAQRAEQPEFDDASWRVIDLPHDWSIEDLPETASPFDRDAISQVNGGFTAGGTGWYRKRLMIGDDMKEKILTILFEGVYMNAECWLNGHSLGSHPYGYTSFSFDITPYIQYGRENILAVKVRNEGENSRWYSGSGIYRHVWLIANEPVHVSLWGTAITASAVSASSAKISLKTDVTNQGKSAGKVKLVTRLIDPLGNEAGRAESLQSLNAGDHVVFREDMDVVNPRRWSTDDPALYTAVAEVFIDGKQTDSEKTIFGIRSISFDPSVGISLNETPLKLKGGCFHHDNGPLGSKAFDRAEERKVELLKASGYNAIRCSHNPPSPALLNACDRLGMLVIDEAFDMWKDEKNPHDYHLYFAQWWQKDIESMVKRDRNHPSVIMWSIGNEIPNRQDPEVVALAKTLADYIRSIDSARPVTAAVNDLKPEQDPYFAALDVAGYNYASGGDHGQQNLYEQDHLRVPERIMAGTESYPLEAFQSWMDVIDHTWVIGDFVWTAFDYIGEASIGWRGYWQEQNFFPWTLAYCGDLDICGWKRPQSFYRDVLWKQDQLSVFVTPPSPSFAQNPDRQSWSKWHWFDDVPSWNWNGSEGMPLQVKVYTSCERTELFLNGKSLGTREANRGTKFTASWQVPFQPGTLKAVGYKGKKIVATRDLVTAGEPVRIKLTGDRTEIQADGQDLCYVTVELTDANGIRNPTAENLVNFTVTGPATIVGVGNANPVSLESFTLPQRKAWQGRCLVILRAGREGGTVKLTASSPGMEGAVIEIQMLQGDK
jgi:beta-galactosidase